MAPLIIANTWQRLCLTIVWYLPIRVQDWLIRRNALRQVEKTILKNRHCFKIAGEVIKVGKRFVFLKIEGVILITLDTDPVFEERDPHLLCVIDTKEMATYLAAHKMLTDLASTLRVPLRIPDEEEFLRERQSSSPKVSNALDGRGIFWNCCGCICLQDTEEEPYNWESEDPRDNGCCNFYEMLASGNIFETNCEEGKEIIAAVRMRCGKRFTNPKRNVIF